jgi:O-antigen ligase
MILYNPYSNGVFVNYLVPTLSILDLGLFLLTVSILKEVKTEVLRKIFQNVKWYLITFLVFILLQNIFLFDFLVLLNTVRFVIVLLLLICMPTLIQSLKTRSFRFSIVIIFLINTLLQGVIGILQFLGGSSLGLKWLGESQVVSGMQGSSFIELFDGLYLRAYGTFPHPNILAGFFLLSFFVSVFFFLRIEKKYKWLPTLLFFSSFFVLFTFSRIVICLFGLNILVFFILFIRKRKIFFSFTPLLFVERFVNLFTGGDTSASDRINLLRSSISVFKENWYMGTGMGRFVKAMEDFVPRTAGGIQLLQPVHNVIMLLLTDFGIFGFISFVILFYKICVLNIKKVNIGVIAIACSIFVISMFDHYLLSLPQGLILMGIFFVLLFEVSKILNYAEDYVDKD